jgi:hypothetical protein
MPTGPLLKDGDIAVFDLQFGPAVVFWAPIKIKGSGPAKFRGKNICEKSVKMDSCPYTVPGYAAPGMGKLTIQLMPNQMCTKTSTGSTKVLLKGTEFIAMLEVKSAAKIAVAPAVVEDPVPMYVGKGRFITLNMTHKAT